MSADGRASAVAVRSTIGTANASVLPDPVGDLASTSSPARASGRTSAWIRNGSWMERAASASTIGGDTQSSRNDCCISLFDSFYGFETCLPRNTRRRNEKLISPGSRLRPVNTRYQLLLSAGALRFFSDQRQIRRTDR